MQEQLILDLDAQQTQTVIYLGWTIEAKLFHRKVTESIAATVQSREQCWRFTNCTPVWETWIESQRWNQRIKVQSALSGWREADRAIEATRSYIRNFYSVSYYGDLIPTVPSFSPSEPGDTRTCELRPVSHTSGYQTPITVWYIALIKGYAEAIIIETDHPFKSETEAWQEIEQMEANGWVY